MKALVVGYGRMGGFHARVLSDLGYEVVTVDPDATKRADFTSLSDALPGRHSWAQNEYEVAAIAVPPAHLLDTAYQLAGVAMLVEKPFALNIRDARMLAAYLEKQKSKVCVGLVERFNPQARALRALMMDGTLRDVESVKFTRWNDRPSFDIALDLRLHDVDLAAFIKAWREGVDVTFDTRDGCDRKIRTIHVTHAEGTTTVDLMDHAFSPLHGLWHAFLTDKPYPTPANVIDALHVLPFTYAAPEQVATAA